MSGGIGEYAKMVESETEVSIPIGEDYADIRVSVRRVCAAFPGSYWRDVEAREAYPSEFVGALTEGGFLAVLIPEEYGGSGLPLRAASVILEEIHASGGNAGACHAQMYTMGTVLRHGSAAQKAKYLPAIAAGELRLQAFGVTEPTTGSDTTKLKTHAVRDGELDGRECGDQPFAQPRLPRRAAHGGAAPDAAGLIFPCSQMTWGIMNTSIAALMPNTLKFTHTLSGKLRAT